MGWVTCIRSTSVTFLSTFKNEALVSTAMATWPGAVSVPRTTFEIKKLFTRLKISPVRCPCSIEKRNLSTLAGTQCVDRTWKALPAQKEVDERSTHKVPLSLFRTPSPRVGLAPLDGKDCFAAAHQNLVKTVLVYPHFAEEKKQSFCGYSTKTRQKSNGIVMISARHGNNQIVILIHGEM